MLSKYRVMGRLYMLMGPPRNAGVALNHAQNRAELRQSV